MIILPDKPICCMFSSLLQKEHKELSDTMEWNYGILYIM